MGRNKKVINGKVVSLRLPVEFLSTKPESYREVGDWLRDILTNKKPMEINGITEEQKKSVNVFYDLFTDLAKKNILLPYLKENPNLIKDAKVLKEMIKNGRQ